MPIMVLRKSVIFLNKQTNTSVFLVKINQNKTYALHHSLMFANDFRRVCLILNSQVFEGQAHFLNGSFY